MRRLAAGLPFLLALLLAACGSPARTAAAGSSDSAQGASAGEASAPAAAPAAAEAGEEPAAAEPALPVPDLGYGAREGRALFGYYCATCHGAEGRGDGLNAYNLDPKPRDLSEPAFQSDRADEDLAAVIRSGGGVAGLSTGMPPWGRTLGDRKIRNIVAFIRTLPAEPASP